MSTNQNKQSMGLRLREARELAGFSQGQVARKMSIHRPTITEIEAGRRNVKVNELTSFSDLYKVELDWLIIGEVFGEREKKIQAATRILNSMDSEELEELLASIEQIKSGRI